MIDIRISNNWNDNDIRFLCEAERDDYTVLQLMADEQRSDDYGLYRVFEDEKHIGSFVCRIDRFETGNELVVVFLGGKSANGQFIQCLCDFWNNLAKRINAKYIRAHVAKKGMAKLMERAGGELTEYVYRKVVL